jgi:hypothetical protein
LDLGIWGFYNYGHFVMEGGANEAVVGRGGDGGDVIGSNSGTATTARQTTSIPLSKKRYKN